MRKRKCVAGLDNSQCRPEESSPNLALIAPVIEFLPPHHHSLRSEDPGAVFDGSEIKFWQRRSGSYFDFGGKLSWKSSDMLGGGRGRSLFSHFSLSPSLSSLLPTFLSQCSGKTETTLSPPSSPSLSLSLPLSLSLSQSDGSIPLLRIFHSSD